MSADAITKAIAIMERDREALRAGHGHPAHGGAIPAEDADATAADAEYGDAIAALRGLREAGEPVAWECRRCWGLQRFFGAGDGEAWCSHCGAVGEMVPLVYAAPPSPAPQGERAQGEVVALPKHETPEMHDAVMSLLYRGVARTETDLLWQAYRKALLAAPQTTEPAAAEAGVLEAARELRKAYVRLLEAGRDRITDLGGQCDPVDQMERSDPALRAFDAAIAAQPQPEGGS